MEIPNGNFFQVTINSQKLLSYINQLSLQLKDQQTKLEQFKTFANGFENQMSRKINQKFSDFNIEWERRHKTNS